MSKIACEVEETLVEVNGKPVAGIAVTCGACDQTVELAGHDCHELRVQALTVLQRECPEHREGHFHFIPAETDE